MCRHTIGREERRGEEERGGEKKKSALFFEYNFDGSMERKLLRNRIGMSGGNVSMTIIESERKRERERAKRREKIVRGKKEVMFKQ